MLLRGMTGDEIADLERALTACGATTTCDRSERAVEMVLFGSRASRRDREAAADRGCPVLERGDVMAVLLARAALDDTDQSIELPEPATGLSLIRSA